MEQASGAGEGGAGYSLCLSPSYSWIGRMVRLVPGARGWLEREKTREADIEIRRYVSSLLSQAVAELEDARSRVASAAGRQWLASAALIPGLPGSQAPLPPPGLGDRIASLSSLARDLSSSILYADSGWAPVSAARKITREEILRLCSYDDTMIGLAEAVRELSRRLRRSVELGDWQAAGSLAAELAEALEKLRALYDERRRFIQLASHQGKGFAERVREAIGGALEEARALLSRLASRLGLRP